MRSLLLPFCFFAVSLASITDDTYRSFDKIVDSYDALVLVTRKVINSVDGDKHELDALLSKKFKVYTIRVIDEMRNELTSLNGTATAIQDNLLALDMSKEEMVKLLTDSWAELLLRIDELDRFISAPREVPPGRAGPPPTSSTPAPQANMDWMDVEAVPSRTTSFLF